MAVRCRLSSSLRKLDRIMSVMNRGQPALAIPFRLLTVSGYTLDVLDLYQRVGVGTVFGRALRQVEEHAAGLETAVVGGVDAVERAAVEEVAPEAAVEGVAACAADQNVVVVAAGEGVFAAETVERVVAG